uniref:Protein transport protein Sec61 subunit beta n=1 Tax=Salix viminalis TaxID=40686 RepID=A0A6N2LI62_SALVM
MTTIIKSNDKKYPLDVFPILRKTSRSFRSCSDKEQIACRSSAVRSEKYRVNEGGTAPPRGSAAAAASMRRRRTTSGGASGGAGAAGTMLQFYTDDAPGLKISPNVVLVMSIGFIAFVAILHVVGKLYLVRREG